LSSLSKNLKITIRKAHVKVGGTINVTQKIYASLIINSNMSRRKSISKPALVIGIILVIAIVAGVTYYIATLPPPGPTIKEIKIGLVEPLTGTHAVFGIEARQAAELVIEHINAEGGIKNLGGAKLRLIIEDSKDTIEGAKLAAEKLISTENVPIIVGAYISRHTAGMAEVTERSKVILVADALVDFLSESGWKYFFRAAPKASIHGATAVDFIIESAKKKGVEIKTIAIINEDSVFGRYVALGAKKRALDRGLKIVAEIEYPYDITDMTPIVTRLKASNPDVVVSVPYFYDGVLFAKTAYEMGFNPKFIAGAGGCGYTDPDSIKAAGKAVEYFSQTYSYDPAKNTPYNKRFVDDFKNRYGKIPTEAGGIIVYSLWTIKEALELAAKLNPQDPLNPDNLREAFLRLDISSGPAADTYPSGHIRFDVKGDNMYAQAVVLQVIEGQPWLVYPFETAQREPVFPRP
jgi:branched-chain amino acid transport system substrate-binding protein